MSLLPEKLAATLPPLFAHEGEQDPVAVLKFILPGTGWAWYVVEYDPEGREFFGLVCGEERELGAFTLDELEETRGPEDSRVARVHDFPPTPLSRCRRTDAFAFDELKPGQQARWHGEDAVV